MFIRQSELANNFKDLKNFKIILSQKKSHFCYEIRKKVRITIRKLGLRVDPIFITNNFSLNYVNNRFGLMFGVHICIY